MRKLILLFLIMALTSCTAGPYSVSSPYYRIPAGSRLVLKQTLTIPPNSARIYIQYGKVITPKERDQYYAHCWFLSRKVLDTAQIITPDTFIVTKTQKYEDDVQIQGAYLLASLHGATMKTSDGGPTAVEYSTTLTIHSDTQPDINQFVCSYWEDPLDAKHLTVAEIRKTLGDIADIQLNSGP